MSNEKQIEQEIQAKGLNAPRLTPDHIDNTIVGETYTNLPDGRTVVCQLTLRNGFTVDGTSACVSKDNFNQEIVEAVNAITKRSNETRKQYLVRCTQNNIAHKVKIADTLANLEASITSCDAWRVEKYSKQLIELYKNGSWL